jgi:hypothetical protein
MINLLAYLIIEPVKRILSAVLYPLAYLLRHWLRTDEEALRHEQASSVGVVLWGHRPGFGWLWYWLDDSINAEGRLKFGKDIDYCAYGNRSDLVEKLPEGKFKEFCRAWYWSAFRNSAINLTWTLCLGDMTGEDIIKGEKPRNFIVRRHYPGGKSRLYVQFYPWGDFRIKCGWLTNGRFEVQFRRKKI